MAGWATMPPPRSTRLFTRPRWRCSRARIVPEGAEQSTQAAFGRILLDLAKSGAPLADRIVTTSPDVTVSTNLGAFVNQRGRFRRSELKDVFAGAKIPSPQKWSGHAAGQHLRVGGHRLLGVGGKRAGGDRVDLDPMWRPLGGERLGQPGALDHALRPLGLGPLLVVEPERLARVGVDAPPPADERGQVVGGDRGERVARVGRGRLE